MFNELNYYKNIIKMMDDNILIIKLLINDKNVFIYTMGKTKEEKNIFLFGKFINFQSEHLSIYSHVADAICGRYTFNGFLSSDGTKQTKLF